MTAAEPQQASDLAVFLPQRVQDWSAVPSDEVYDADGLFGYIDGGAEVYRAFGVRKVLGRKFVRKGGPDLMADVFDMGTIAGAYGAYHHDLREGPDAGIGRESERTEGALAFWKGRYFVSLMTVETTAASQSALEEIARAVAAAIHDEAAAPEIASWVPPYGLVRGNVHYFRTAATLQSRFSLPKENLLRLTGDTEGILARYAGLENGVCEAAAKGAPFTILIVRYPSEALALEAYREVADELIPNANAEGMMMLENGKWNAARTMGPVLVVVLDAPGRHTPADLIADVKKLSTKAAGGESPAAAKTATPKAGPAPKEENTP